MYLFLSISMLYAAHTIQADLSVVTCFSTSITPPSSSIVFLNTAAVSINFAQYGSSTISTLASSVKCRNCVIAVVPQLTSSPLTKLANGTSHSRIALSSFSENPILLTYLISAPPEWEHTTNAKSQKHEEPCHQKSPFGETEAFYPSPK